jgi:hypothetical protein
MYKPTLTTDEAERIVSIVQRILTSQKLAYGYRLSELQGYSRIDVAHAFMIHIAHVYKDGRNHPDFKKDFPTLVDAMDSSLISIASTGIPDSELPQSGSNYELSTLIDLAGRWSLISIPGNPHSNPATTVERKIFGRVEMPSSIAEYCSEVIQPYDPEYWQKVYAHIGLDYPNREKSLELSKEKVSKMDDRELRRRKALFGGHPIVKAFYILSIICWYVIIWKDPHQALAGIVIMVSLFVTWVSRGRSFMMVGGPVGILLWLIEPVAIVRLIPSIATFVLWLFVVQFKWNGKQNEWQHMNWKGYSKADRQNFT